MTLEQLTLWTTVHDIYIGGRLRPEEEDMYLSLFHGGFKRYELSKMCRVLATTVSEDAWLATVGAVEISVYLGFPAGELQQLHELSHVCRVSSTLASVIDVFSFRDICQHYKLLVAHILRYLCTV